MLARISIMPHKESWLNTSRTHHLHKWDTQRRQGLCAGLGGLCAQGVYVIHIIGWAACSSLGIKTQALHGGKRMVSWHYKKA